MLNKLLEQKPDLSREDIEERIQQKKDKIGEGYLTDQGALHLVASDLELTVSEPIKTEMGLRDLYVGAKEITLETRVLNFSPAKQFTRKDGTPFFLRTMTVYDGEKTASVKLWDEKANMESLKTMKPGDLIKIIKAYVKSDLNGSPTINVGSGSTIEVASGDSEIPSIDSITVNVDSTKENQTDLVVSGIITGSISTLNFTNSKGQPGTGLRFSLKGDGTTMRVVLWGKDESILPKMIPNNSKVRLLGVKTKPGQQGLEIHGNDSTIVEIEGEKEVEPIVGRILSVSDSQTGKKLAMIIDKSKKIHKLNDSAKKLGTFNENDVIECMPSKIFGDLITLDDNSFVRKIEDDSLPNFSDYRTKISQIIEGNDYCIEGIVLKEPERREVQTKSGESISLSEVFVGDDSAEIWLKGWREQADLIDKCALGERFSVTAVNAKSGLEGRIELFLTSFSKIKQKN